MFGPIKMDVYGRDSANCSDSVLHTSNIFKSPFPTFSVSWLRASVCRISEHSCPSLRSLLPLLFFFFLGPFITKLHLKHYHPKTTFLLAPLKPNRLRICLRQGASGGAPSTAGGEQGPRLRRDRFRLRRNHQCTGRVQCTGMRRNQHMVYWLELPGPSPTICMIRGQAFGSSLLKQ